MNQREGKETLYKYSHNLRQRNVAGLRLHKMVNVLDMNNSEMFSRMYKQTKMKKKKCLKFIFICLDRCKVILYMEKNAIVVCYLLKIWKI